MRTTLFLMMLALLLTGCGGSNNSTSDGSSLSVDGAAVKGPLIGASITAYLLDTQSPDLKGDLIARGSTDQQAKINLEIPQELLSQSLLLIEFSDGTEISGAIPEINNLTTVLSASQLTAGTPVYATPLSTFAIYYAQKIADLPEQSNDVLTAGLIGNQDGLISIDEFSAALQTSSNIVKGILGLGVLDEEIDLFTTSPLIDGVSDHQDALAFRTSNEVFAAIVIQLKDELSSNSTVLSGTAVLERLAEDFRDGTFDGAQNGANIPELNNIADIGAVFEQNPALLTIPGTQALISALPNVVIEELTDLQRPAPDVQLAPLVMETPSATILDENEPDPVTPPPNVAPIVSFATPANNTTLSEGNSLTVIINATDTDGSIGYCELYFRNIFIGRDSSSPYQFSGSALNNLVTGTHSAVAHCRDNLGLTTDAQITINVEAQAPPDPVITPVAPSVSFNLPANNTVLQEGGSMSVSLNASDSDGSITYCDLSLNGTLVRRDTSAPFSYGTSDAALNSLSAGNYTLNATCTDSQGLSATAQRSFTVNPAPVAPTLSFASPANNTVLQEGDTLSVSLNASDSDGSIAYCDLLLNGALVRRDTSAPFSYGASDAALNSLSAGNYTLNAICTDSQGLDASRQINFSVEATPAPTSANVALDWVVPAAREDGSTLNTNEIDSYEIYYYLASSSSAGISITIPAFNNGGSLQTSHTIQDVASGNYLFTIATVDTEGNVSQFTNPIAIAIP